MTLKSLFNQNESYSAEDFRAIAGMFHGEGVLYGFGHTVDSATQITFDPGVAVVEYDNNTPDEPYYYIRSDDDEVVTSISAPTGSDYRVYLFYVAADDSYIDGSGGDTPTLGQVSNDNVGSYVDPSLPDNSVAILKVEMEAGESLVSGATITDMRTPPLTWNESGYNSFTPTYTNITIGNASVNTGVWSRVGDLVTFRTYLRFGSTTTVDGWVEIDLPFPGAASPSGEWLVTGLFYKSSTARYWPVLIRQSATFDTVALYTLVVSDGNNIACQSLATGQPHTAGVNDSLQLVYTYRTSSPFGEAAFS